MANPEFDVQPTQAAAPEQQPAVVGETAPTAFPSSDNVPSPEQDVDSTPMTKTQAEQIVAELKTIRQNLRWVLLLGGFFAARALFFHY
ncbi:hypothetical protein VB780_30195 [Leptolyngbya sp. CCNP1308]|uniref:hypothetical protein n=1 Tax=Leptolyngbya sp. CCNP1308 TaxID=3110255 RepID=UPI002B215C89|nr:hypothetical protein [Leptolyngbya sp. CCNP1308]MEA5452881.1 hypothetical protein [Leptolyngbya sp. CCNP1308]